MVVAGRRAVAKKHVEVGARRRTVPAMPAEPIRYFDRQSRAVKTEHIYGERWMRLAYENPVGRLLVWGLIRRAFFSKWYGHKMRKPESALRILPFISKYEIDVDEFAKSPFDYKTFNEFFYRALRPEARPIAGGEKVAYFEGTPIPTTFLLTGLLALAAWQGRVGQDIWWGTWHIGPGTLHPLSLLFILSGSLMISKTLRIPKL